MGKVWTFCPEDISATGIHYMDKYEAAVSMIMRLPAQIYPDRIRDSMDARRGYGVSSLVFHVQCLERDQYEGGNITEWMSKLESRKDLKRCRS